ncbi:MAG: hypothetical protein J6D21_04535 [Clostridia bacterium]|nr:hypothetical protein [Clostridia bacterium]
MGEKLTSLSAPRSEFSERVVRHNRQYYENEQFIFNKTAFGDDAVMPDIIRRMYWDSFLHSSAYE